MKLWEAVKLIVFFDKIENFIHQVRIMGKHCSSEIPEAFKEDFTEQTLLLSAYPEFAEEINLFKFKGDE